MTTTVDLNFADIDMDSTPELHFGSMKIHQPKMSVLLVFAKHDDVQCNAFKQAANDGKYKCHIRHNAEDALHSYFENQHQVIFIDTRPQNGFVPVDLCRFIRNTENSNFTVIVAVRQQNQVDPSTSILLNAGFNKQFIENTSVVHCLGELQLLESYEVMTQSILKATRALMTALDQCTDAVKVTSENHQIQYVNSAYERMVGCKQTDVVGKIEQMESKKFGRSMSDVSEPNTSKLQNGNLNNAKQNSENSSENCQIFPVLGQSGKVHHLVEIHRLNKVPSSAPERSLSISSPYMDANLKRVRRESMAKLSPMAVGSTISEVINTIGELLETCPQHVVEPLGKILEKLRSSSEIFAPCFPKQLRDDKMSSELVGGLMALSTSDDDVLTHRRMSLQAKRVSFSSDEPLFVRKAGPFHSGTLRHGERNFFIDLNITGIKHNSPEVVKLLDEEASWKFDVIKLETFTHKRPLVHLAMMTFQRFKVLDFLKVDEKVLVSWLGMVESNYRQSNHYHNSTHAADVMHATAYFLGCDMIMNLFDSADQVAALVAAVIHDFDHPGKTNRFLINSNDELAALYNGLGVLENYHVSIAIRKTLTDTKFNIFQNLPRDAYLSLQQSIVDMVLATDMAKHSEYVIKFVSVFRQADNIFDLVTSKTDNLVLVKRILIKCADISNPARPRHLCIEWAKRIAYEYCLQTEAEKSLKLSLSLPTFDFKTFNLEYTQTRFMQLFVNEMFEAWTEFCDLPEMARLVKDNYEYWEEEEARTFKNKKNPDK